MHENIPTDFRNICLVLLNNIFVNIGNPCNLCCCEGISWEITTNSLFGESINNLEYQRNSVSVKKQQVDKFPTNPEPDARTQAH